MRKRRRFGRHFIIKQLQERAVAPWDCKSGHHKKVLPKGMYEINWRVKAGSDEVRITANMRPLFEEKDVGYLL